MDKFLKLTNQINVLKKKVENFNVGKSVLNKNIVCFKLGGCSKNNVMILGGVNGCEINTCFFTIKLIEFFKNFKLKNNIYFVPLVNPDGVDICLNSAKNILKEKQRKLITCMLKYFEKKYFKANANGVEINKNFENFWGEGSDKNKFTPMPKGFIGKKANSQKETRSLSNLIKKIKPNMIINFCGEDKYVVCFTKDKSIVKKNIYFKLFAKILKNKNQKLKFKNKDCGSLESFSLENFDTICFRVSINNLTKNENENLSCSPLIFNENKDVVLSLLNLC